MALTRTVALILVVAIAFSIAACGRKTPPVMPTEGSSGFSAKTRT